MSEWTELKDLQAVAQAQAEGWEIEKSAGREEWGTWHGTAWYSQVNYRGRPKTERKVVRVREAVVGHGSELEVIVITHGESLGYTESGRFLGWVKGSEWREVEYD